VQQITNAIRKIASDITAKKISTPYGHKTLDLSYEIPYLAGYSKDGKTIYIDKRLKPVFELKSGKKINIVKYLIVHESSEKHFIDVKNYKYPYAHEKATKLERKAVEDDGYPWIEYQKYALSEVQRIKKLDSNEPLPKDLDDRPERDTHDYYRLEEIKEHKKLTR
jgi:hypothetical protein